MTDQLIEDLAGLRRTLTVDRAAYGGTATKRFIDQMTTLCCLVSQLADRLPAEAKTSTTLREAAAEIDRLRHLRAAVECDLARAKSVWNGLRDEARE